MNRRRPPIRDCVRCRRPRPHHGRGLCESCHAYVRRPYVPTGAGRGGPGLPKAPRALAGRIEDYAEIRGRHYSVDDAAARLQISIRTAWRYEARLRSQQEGAAA